MCSPQCLRRNAVVRSNYIGIFTTVAATCSSGTLAWIVASVAADPASDNSGSPSRAAALHEQWIILVLALIVNVLWIFVGISLIVAMKRLIAGLTLPFLFFCPLYLLYCAGTIVVCLYRIIDLVSSGQSQQVPQAAYSSVALCLLAMPVYVVFLTVVYYARRQMLSDQGPPDEGTHLKM